MDALLRAVGITIAATCLAGGCAHPWTARLTLPARYSVVRDQLVIHSDFALTASHRLLTELTTVRNDLGQRLGIPVSDEPIHVYLFENEEEFRAFVRLYHPEFPDRRAFFLETDTRLQIYAQWGDHLGEDLRHEVTHGYLHATIPNLPLWLDEGIAEYYEVPRANRGLNRTDLECLASAVQRRQHQPNLARLEKFDPSCDMTQEDYSEAWGWVYFLLETRREHRDILKEYLEDLRRFGSADPLVERLRPLVPEPDRALAAFVQTLAVSVRQ